MRRYIFNGIGLGGEEQYGIHRYAAEIIRELDRLVDPGWGEIAVPTDVEIKLPLENIALTYHDSRLAGKTRGRLWSQVLFPRYARSEGIGVDLVLGLPRGGCDVVALYDCIIETFPGFATDLRTKLSRQEYIFRARGVTSKSKAIVTDSEYAKGDIVDYYHVDPAKVHVIPAAWQHTLRFREDESILKRLGLAESDYFFALGSRYVHKNFRWIVCAARQNPQYRFVVTGTNALSKGDRRLDDESPDNLVFTGYLSDGEIKALMAHCRAFIQPSLSEGFGIPPMEAMAAGARCIVSRAASLPEVYGDSVWYIDPSDYEHVDLDQIMAQPIPEPNECVLGRHTWKRSAEMLLDVLERVGR